MKAEVKRFNDIGEASRELAFLVAERIREKVRERGLASLGLSGGGTPRTLFAFLGEHPSLLPWEKTHLFWVDERYVPRDDPASNFRLAKETFLDQVGIPPANLHPVDISLPLQEAAQAFEEDIRTFFNASSTSGLDLLLLGMGSDGHTGSLFPGSQEVQEQHRLVRAVPEPKGTPPVPRVTMTLPLINSSQVCCFLAQGDAKCRLAQRIIDGDGETRRLPAAMVAPREELFWFLVC